MDRDCHVKFLDMFKVIAYKFRNASAKAKIAFEIMNEFYLGKYESYTSWGASYFLHLSFFFSEINLAVFSRVILFF